jgi:hypothetical protein
MQHHEIGAQPQETLPIVGNYLFMRAILELRSSPGEREARFRPLVTRSRLCCVASGELPAKVSKHVEKKKLIWSRVGSRIA